MRPNFSSILLTATLAVPTIGLISLGCADTAVEAVSDATDVDKEILTVNPSNDLHVGFSDRVELHIGLTDSQGRPLVGKSVDAVFVDQSFDATISPSRFITDSNGLGTVVFTAPTPFKIKDDTLSLKIRFRSADTESFVDVLVDPELIQISFEVDYQGKREFTRLDAILYSRDTDTENGSETKIAESVYSGTLPTTIAFVGLIGSRSYKVEVVAQDASAVVGASGTLDDIRPNMQGLSLLLEDIPLTLIGQYDASFTITTDGALNWTVDELIKAALFAAKPEEAVLNGIADELATDAFAAATFATERAENKWDETLLAYFENRGVDVPGTFAELQGAAQSALRQILLTGVLEFGKDGEGNNTVFYNIEDLTFGQGGPVYLVPMQEASTGKATLGSNDELILSEHDVPIPLGDPFSLLLTGSIYSEILGSQELAHALQTMVDCSATATFLEPLLSDLAVRSTIELGCLTAAETAAEQVGDALVTFNQASRLSFADATCTAVVPESGNEVESFTCPPFAVTWHTDERDAVPMSVELSARLPQ
jgi:hypothetical protein